MKRRDVLALGGLALMAGTTGLSQPGEAAASASPSARRAELYALLGALPDRQRPGSGQKTAEAERARRPHLGIVGKRDRLTPPAGIDRIDRELKAEHARHGHPERWKLVRYDVEHVETAEGRREAAGFLQRYL